MAGYRLEYDHDWELEVASDGRKRRSFLPAPKKGSGASPTSPQQPGNATFLPQSQQLDHPSNQFPSHHRSRQEQQQQQQQQHYYQQQAYQQSHPPQDSQQYQRHSFQRQQPSQQQPPPAQYHLTQHHDDVSGGKRSSSADSSHKRTSSGSPHPDFGQGIRVGARIKIGGVKPGIVRYLGTIHLAPGIFCGVELADADGPHDGEVDGHRYFNCLPKHGIFAPKNKVCLDSSFPPLKRLSSDSDPCYSSNESLAERSNQALRHYSEGELEAVDCSKISPTASEEFGQAHPGASRSSSYTRVSRAHEKKVNLNATYDLDDARGSSQSSGRDFDDLPDPDVILNTTKSQRSVLPRPRSSLPAPTSSAGQSRLPTFSRSFVKSAETITCPPDQLPASNRAQVKQNANRTQTIPSSDKETVASFGESSSSSDSQHRASAGSRSSEDSEEDGVPKDRLSSGVKHQLQGDSRQYLNFTFDKDLRDSLDHDESSSDSNSKDNASYVQYQTPKGRTKSPSADSIVVGDASSHSILSEDILADNSLISGQPLAELLQTKTYKKSERRRTSTPIESRSRQSQILESRSYTVGQGQGYLQHVVHESPDVINYESPVDEDDIHSSRSTSQSVSDVDLPLDGESRVTSDNGWDRQFQGQMLMEGGYPSNVLDGDGNSATGLSFPPPIETLSSSDNLGIAPDHASTKRVQTQPPASSESYTVTKEVQGEGDAKSKDHFVPSTVSKSYTVAATKVEHSTASDKVRHSSTSSSANGGDSTSSGTDPKTESSRDGKGEQVDDSSNGVSPEVSQTLEWDYGQDFDGKIPLHNNENTMSGSASTGTSESLSDVLRDESEHSDVIEPELASGATEDSDLFETPENDFENIDSLEDFPIFGKNPKAIMTDSGISDKDFEFNMAKSSSTICGNSSDECSREDDTSLATAKAIGSDSSQETIAAELIADTPVSVEEKDLPGDNPMDVDDLSQVDSATDGYSNSPGSVTSVVEVTSPCGKMDALKKELLHPSDVQTGSDAGYTLRQGVLGDESGKKERPISLLSTTSADTGYAPDTDSEIGTLTTNTPSEWVDKQGVTHPTSYAPIEDLDDLNSPVDGYDFLKKESLALSRALRQQNSTQSTVSNPSDTEDFREYDTSDATVISTGLEDGCPEMSKTQVSSPQPEPMETQQNVFDEPENIDDTEDDRIEADQVHGPPGSSGSSHPSTREGTPPKLTLVSGETDGEVSIPGEQEEGLKESDNKDQVKDETGVTTKTETEKAVKETPDKANESDSKKPKTRKGLVMTKKKMEVIDHKLPNTKVASKLADYIKAPTPVKPKEEKDVEENKISKNIKNISKKKISVTNLGTKLDNNNRAQSADNVNEDENNENNKNRRKTEKIEKPKPIIKRTPPKSKWGNIMSQIEASKDTAKPKPKSEIKSSLAAYLSAPPPATPATGSTDAIVNIVNGEANPPPPPRKEFKSRHKPLPPPPPKIDLSKVKSKLSVPTAASVSKKTVKRESSPSVKGPRSAGTSRESSPAAGPLTRARAARLDKARASEGNIVLVRQPLPSTTDSLRSSRTDLSTVSVDESVPDEGTSSKSTSLTENGTKKDRRHSTNSAKSSISDKSKLKNGDVDSTRKTRASVKSTRPSNSPARMAPRTIEIRLDSSPAGSSRRSSTASPTPIIIKAVAKPRTNSTGRPAPVSAINRQKSPDRPSKGRNSMIAHGTQKGRLVNGTAKPPATTAATTSSASNNKRIAISSSSAQQSKTSKEVVRLESLCEARTKELTHTKMQLKATIQGFDAMAVLLNYCCTELDAFECPQLAQKLEKVQKQLTDCMAEIGDLNAQKDTLTENLNQITKDKEEESKRADDAIATAITDKEEHDRQQKEIDNTHNAALTAQRDELTSKHEDQAKKMRQKQDYELKHLRDSFERKMSAMANEGKLELSTLRLSHLEQIEALRAKHDSQMEELHKQHRNKLEDITHRFESIKVALSDKVESLRGECEDLRVRTRASEEALQKDADVKVQMALAPFINLPKEIESLKTVLEMRNEEIQKLRSRNMDLEKQLEEIPIAREKIISLKQKVENLEAIINIKTDHEKQMHEKCQVLMRKYDRESRANKRLSMDYEQVMWRMSQSEYGSNESLTKRQLSRSPPRSETTSPDPRRRRLSPNTTNSDVTLRVKKRSSNSESDGDRKLRSRSATFVLEKDEDLEGQAYVPDSTQSTPRRGKKKSNGHHLKAGTGEETNDPRMCHSAGAELITAALEGSKQVWDIDMSDSHNSVLNDEGMDSLPMGSSTEMASSYARSISGVSDSGVYDSMTRSDMLNSSILSTDSEWMASANASMTLDSTNEEDLDPFVNQKVTNSDTVLDMTRVQCDRSHNDASISSSSSITSADATVYDNSQMQDITSYDFHLNLPEGNEDDVFTPREDNNISTDLKSDNFMEKTSSACEVEVSLSHKDSAISSNLQSQPPGS